MFINALEFLPEITDFEQFMGFMDDIDFIQEIDPEIAGVFYVASWLSENIGPHLAIDFFSSFSEGWDKAFLFLCPYIESDLYERAHQVFDRPYFIPTLAMAGLAQELTEFLPSRIYGALEESQAFFSYEVDLKLLLSAGVERSYYESN